MLSFEFDASSLWLVSCSRILVLDEVSGSNRRDGFSGRRPAGKLSVCSWRSIVFNKESVAPPLNVTDSAVALPQGWSVAHTQRTPEPTVGLFLREGRLEFCTLENAREKLAARQILWWMTPW